MIKIRESFYDYFKSINSDDLHTILLNPTVQEIKTLYKEVSNKSESDFFLRAWLVDKKKLYAWNGYDQVHYLVMQYLHLQKGKNKDIIPLFLHIDNKNTFKVNRINFSSEIKDTKYISEKEYLTITHNQNKHELALKILKPVILPIIKNCNAIQSITLPNAKYLDKIET